MELLPDVKDQLIEKITILIALPALNPGIVKGLADLCEHHRGQTALYFRITDPDTRTHIDLFSRPFRLSVGREVIGYLREHPEMSYTIN